MNADRAREITAAAKQKAGNIATLVTHVMVEIEAAAQLGNNQILNPLAGLRCPINDEQRQKVYAQLEQKGFVVLQGENVIVSW